MVAVDKHKAWIKDKDRMKYKLPNFLLNLLFVGGFLWSAFACTQKKDARPISSHDVLREVPSQKIVSKRVPVKKSFSFRLAKEAEKRLKAAVRYDGRYCKIAYPMGDVPAHIGVCTDVVIRSYRGVGIDLQERVHLDMKAHFSAYPKNWGLRRPDTNIDHRRVPNLMTFFTRAGARLPVSRVAADYRPGDLVVWDLGRGILHIGVVSTQRSRGTGVPLIVHNIGAGPQQNDILFSYKIIGHFRYPNPEKLRSEKG